MSCGIAIACTKCSWKRGSTAVSTFSTSSTTRSISLRAARFSSAIQAPVPAALPADVTPAGSQSGTSPRTSACTGSMCAPKAPARRTRSTLLDPVTLHQQAAARVERRLRELDLPHVVLRDRQAPARPTRGRRRTCARRGRPAAERADERAVDRPVGREDPRKQELGDDLDDARSTDARDPDAGKAGHRPTTSSQPIDLDARLERLRVDPHPLDRPGRRALSAADLGALERRPGRARRGKEALAVSEHDLGIRADVDEKRDLIGEVRRLREDHARRYPRRRGPRCRAGHTRAPRG